MFLKLTLLWSYSLGGLPEQTRYVGLHCDYTRPEWMRMITIYTSYWGQAGTASISLQTLPQENAYNFSNVIIIFLLNSKFSKQCTLQRFLSLSILKQSKSLSCVAAHILHVRHNKTLSCLLSYKNHHFHYLLLSLLLMSQKHKLILCRISQGSLKGTKQSATYPTSHRFRRHEGLETSSELLRLMRSGL